jgi:hypothetical protein
LLAGAGVGALFGLAAALIPGAGPFIAAGTLASALGSAAAGGAVAGAIVWWYIWRHCRSPQQCRLRQA